MINNAVIALAISCGLLAINSLRFGFQVYELERRIRQLEQRERIR